MRNTLTVRKESCRMVYYVKVKQSKYMLNIFKLGSLKL